MPAPFPAPVAAGQATERTRLGTFVLTGGRLELGLGTGYVPAGHEAAGLPYGSPRERVDHCGARSGNWTGCRVRGSTSPGPPSPGYHC